MPSSLPLPWVAIRQGSRGEAVAFRHTWARLWGPSVLFRTRWVHADGSSADDDAARPDSSQDGDLASAVLTLDVGGVPTGAALKATTLEDGTHHIAVPPGTSAEDAHMHVLRVLSRHPAVLLPWPHYLARVALIKPTAEAVSCGGSSMTFHDLTRLGVELRDYLYERLGVVRGTRVSVAHSDEPESWLSFAVVSLALGLLGAQYGVLELGDRMTPAGKRHVLKTWKPAA